MKFLIISTLILTNIVSLVKIPFTPHYDFAKIQTFISGDNPTNFYGIKLQSLDINKNVLSQAEIMESYVPANNESVIITLPPSSCFIKFILLGNSNNFEKIWNNRATLYFLTIAPIVKIKRLGNQFYIYSTNDYSKNYTLQRKLKNGNWINSSNIVKNIGSGIFRLKREINLIE